MLKDFNKITIYFDQFDSFEPVDEENVSFEVEDINLSSLDDKVFALRYKILSGSKKGLSATDYISYVPYQSTSFKMPKFLRALGLDEGEHNPNDWVGMKFKAHMVRGESKKQPGVPTQFFTYLDVSNDIDSIMELNEVANEKKVEPKIETKVEPEPAPKPAPVPLAEPEEKPEPKEVKPKPLPKQVYGTDNYEDDSDLPF